MKLSIVIPVYNEEESLAALTGKLLPAVQSITPDYEVLFVNDGSSDRSARLLGEMAAGDSHIKALHFSRNFGHQAAVTAGLDFADGDAVVVMDADLQDPPELLPQMVALWREGFDVVSAQRVSRSGDSAFKRATATGFYWVMRKFVDRRLQREVGDFRLLSRRAVIALRGFREQHRFMRGLIAWLGLREATLPFQRQERIAGATKYPVWKMIQFAWVAITSFSALPLRLTVVVGMASAAFGSVLVFWALYSQFVLHRTVPGWTSLVMIQALFSGVTLTAVGLTGEYVARIYEEIKRRPLYILGKTDNVEAAVSLPRTIILAEPPAVIPPSSPKTN